MIKKKIKSQIKKEVKVSSDAKIICDSLKIGRNAVIKGGVELRGKRIEIGDGSVINSNVKLSGKLIKIGDNSTIKKNSRIFTIEGFEMGSRSDLCFCDIKGRKVKIGNDFYSSVSPGKILIIGEGNALYPKSYLTIGDRCTVHDILINIAMPVKIGNDVGISHGAQFYTHYFWNSIFEGYPQKFKGIMIGDRCIIGAEAFFLPGVTIGKDCIIAARAVVTKNFPNSCIISGNPARIIKKNNRKKISETSRKEMIKETLLWYNQILQTKGFSVKKSGKGSKFYVTNERMKAYILFSNNGENIPKKKYSIILSFRKIPSNNYCTTINLKTEKIHGVENELTDDLRDFLRKVGIRIFTKRKFKSFKPKTDF